MSSDGQGSGIVERVRSLHRGQQLALAVAVAYLLFLGAGAATAPAPAGSPVDGGDRAGANDSGYGDRTTLIGLQGPFTGREGYAMLVSGDLVQQWRSGESWANFDVTPLADGRVLTAFIEKGATDCGEYSPPCPRTGFRIYDVANGTLDREWTFPVARTHNSEVHDVEPLPTGEILVVDMVAERVFAVDPSGEVTWEWHAGAFYEAPENPGGQDWLHMNDVDRIGEGRYLVSVRNANQLLVVERGEGVVEVINADDGGSDGTCLDEGRRLVPGADGDVRCGNPGVIHDQHNPQWLGEGRVLVADSENDRITELRERNGSWRPAVNYTGAGGVPFNWPRDADLLENGNLLITDTFNNRVVEIDRNGTLVWSARTGKGSIPYEADRMPHGEYPPGVLNRTAGNWTVPPGGSVSQPERVEIPGVSLLFTTLVGTVPVPYWVTQWHLLGFLVALPACLGGLLWARYTR
ncbi:MAG: aryl-sulfate sulfotransferase [Halobacteriales archaeon]